MGGAQEGRQPPRLARVDEEEDDVVLPDKRVERGRVLPRLLARLAGAAHRVAGHRDGELDALGLDAGEDAPERRGRGRGLGLAGHAVGELEERLADGV